MQEYLTATPVASIIFVITLIGSLFAFSNEELYGRLMMHPYSVYRGKSVYTLITSGFIHRDWMHLIFNMVSYYAFAFYLERLIGHWQFGLLYFVSMILSDLPSVAKHRNDYNYYSLGASGAISAVLFSFILFDPMSGLYILPFPFAIPAIVFGPLYLLYCTYASKYSQDNINHDAHLFGALSGLMITIALYPKVIPFFLHQVIAVVQPLLHR